MKNHIKSLIVTGAVALTFCLANPTAYAAINVKPGSGEVYDIQYNEGRNQIHELAKTAENEDAWLYIKNKWHDIGYSEEKEGVEVSMDEILDLLKDKHIDQEVISVHIHPEKSKPVVGGIYPPAPYDIYVHARLKRRIREELKINLKSEVYDGHGVWKYDITDDLASRLHEISEYGEGFYLLTVSMEIQKLKKEILQNNSLPKKERIEKYLQAIKDIGIICTYMPINDTPEKQGN